MRSLRFALAALAACWPGLARATDVEVHILNVADGAGQVRALLFGKANWLSDDPSYRAVAPAHPGENTVVVRNVPPGVYGIVGHHDSNGDGDVTRNFIGIPVEGIGFSNGVRIGLRAPRFDEAAISIAGPRVVVVIRLQFEN